MYFFLPAVLPQVFGSTSAIGLEGIHFLFVCLFFNSFKDGSNIILTETLPRTNSKPSYAFLTFFFCTELIIHYLFFFPFARINCEAAGFWVTVALPTSKICLSHKVLSVNTYLIHELIDQKPFIIEKVSKTTFASHQKRS